MAPSAIEKTDVGAKKVLSKDYRVRIRVIDSVDKPVSGADVTLFSTPRYAKTNKEGVVMFESVEPGRHTVKIVYKNYLAQRPIIVGEDGAVVLSGKQSQEYTVKLMPSDSWYYFALGSVSTAIMFGVIAAFAVTIWKKPGLQILMTSRRWRSLLRRLRSGR